MIPLLVLLSLVTVQADYVLQKHSFWTPYSKIGSNLAWWDTSGSTVIHDSYVSLTPNEKSAAGQIWNNRPLLEEEWEITAKIVIGQTGGQGADGMAFWLTKERGQNGPAFGNTDRFEGLGIIFDTFDNDYSRRHPAIYAVLGNGVTTFDHSKDGGSQQIAYCKLDYRVAYYDTHSRVNHQHPTEIVITYKNGILSLNYDTMGSPQRQKERGQCFSVPVKIPTGYYLGVTAATGGLSDYHDIISFSLNSLSGDFDSPVKASRFQEKEKVMNAGSKANANRRAASTASVLPGVDAFVKDVEARQIQFSVALQSRFQGLSTKVSSLESVTVSSIQSVSQSIQSLTEKLSGSKKTLETLKTDLAELGKVMDSLEKTLQDVQSYATETSQANQRHRSAIDGSKARFNQSVEGHSSGFWIFFLVFQLFFFVSIFFWKKNSDDRKHRFQ